MYIIKSVISVALFAIAAIAQSSIQFTSVPNNVQAGQSYTITWQGGDSTAPVTILLRKGSSTDLKTVGTLTSSATGGSYTWAVDSTIVNGGDYALQIVQGTENNYSGQFPVTGGSNAPLSSAPASASTSASAKASLTTSASASVSASASASDSASSTDSASATDSSSSAAASSTAADTSASSTSTTTSSSGATTSAPSSGASGLQSPIALIMGAVAAMLYFN